MVKNTARFMGTQAGFRVTITTGPNEKVIASQHFNFCFNDENGWGEKAIDRCFEKAKKWAAGFGCAI